MSELPVLIAGGGIGGLTAALCLARRGKTVQVFEKAEAFSEVGAGIQLSPNCTRVLHDLGFEWPLMAAGFLPQSNEMRDYRSGKVLMAKPLGDAVVKEYGFPYYISIAQT